jgi:hypothetical protein
MKYLKLYEEFENKVSIFDVKTWKNLLPKKLTIINDNGEWELNLSDTNNIDGNNIQIDYYQNTPDKNGGDVLADGEPDYLEIEIITVKDNDGTHANSKDLRLNVNITYGDSMVSQLSIDEKNNEVNVSYYTGKGSMHDPNTNFSFKDDSLKELIEFFNRFSDKLKLSIKDFTNLDEDPNSYKPNYKIQQ